MMGSCKIARPIRDAVRVPFRIAITNGITNVDSAHNTFVIIAWVDCTISYYSEQVQDEILALPDTLAARYVVLTRRMVVLGPNLGEPHTKAFGEGLFEFRLKGAEGIARVFYCTLIGKRVVMLHSFVKKTNKTPPRELHIAESRMKEMKHAKS